MKEATREVIKHALTLRGGRSRPDKSLPFIFSLLDKAVGETILDVGCGRGTIGQAVNAEYGEKFLVDAVDVWPAYYSEDMLEWYDNVYYDNFLKSYQKYSAYDIYLFIDVLEHFCHDDAVKIVNYFKGCGMVIASIPNAPKHWEQAKVFEDVNKHEEHKHNWTNEEIELTLGLKLIGEKDAIGVFSNILE